MKRNILLTLLAFILFFTACKKQDDGFTSAAISDYAPYKVGKYITYKLDSFVFVNFGTKDTTISYQVKYTVDAAITDNLGRPAFRIIRYIRKTAADTWQPDNTFMAVNTGNTLEFIEDNLRYAKLKLPINNGFSWKGNSYIDTYSLNSEVKYLDDWDFTYDSVGVSLSLPGASFADALKVSQRDEEIGNPSDPNSYSEKNYCSENYVLGIGMVYRRFLHQEYQPPTPGNTGYKLGYGITLTMIDHN